MFNAQLRPGVKTRVQQNFEPGAREIVLLKIPHLTRPAGLRAIGTRGNGRTVNKTVIHRSRSQGVRSALIAAQFCFYVGIQAMFLEAFRINTGRDALPLSAPPWLVHWPSQD